MQIDEETEPMTEADRMQEAIQADAMQTWVHVLQQHKEKQLCIPHIPGDVMPPEDLLAPIGSDYLIPHRNDCDDVDSALTVSV